MLDLGSGVKMLRLRIPRFTQKMGANDPEKKMCSREKRGKREVRV
jgi:hypothetical protein